MSREHRKLKGDYFGRRVNSWFAISKLMEMRDSGLLVKYACQVVNMAIDVEIEQHINKIWVAVEA